MKSKVIDSTAVVVGRDTPTIKHSNDEIQALVKGRKELVGISSVDPHATGVKAAMAEVERAVKLGLKAINVEPSFGSPPDVLESVMYRNAERVLKLTPR